MDIGLSGVRLGIGLEKAIKELQDWGFIGKVDTYDINQIDVAYTWEYPDSDIRERKSLYLNGLGVTMIGRYGKWKFQGIAESIKDGLSC